MSAHFILFYVFMEGIIILRPHEGVFSNLFTACVRARRAGADATEPTRASARAESPASAVYTSCLRSSSSVTQGGGEQEQGGTRRDLYSGEHIHSPGRAGREGATSSAIGSEQRQ